jgi:hypothetical protein
MSTCAQTNAIAKTSRCDSLISYDRGGLPSDVENFVHGLSYLKPRFELRWQDKPLDQLSPGERGNLLLVFYLLIDERDVPLIIDQPEENLANYSIATTLIPALKYAKNLRQIIIVTHNPKLAVVCDADQIVHADIDKTDGNRVTYTAGAIENTEITRLVVDVLEGTKPAFDLRDAKYEVLERLTSVRGSDEPVRDPALSDNRTADESH